MSNQLIDSIINMVDEQIDCGVRIDLIRNKISRRAVIRDRASIATDGNARRTQVRCRGHSRGRSCNMTDNHSRIAGNVENVNAILRTANLIREQIRCRTLIDNFCSVAADVGIARQTIGS